MYVGDEPSWGRRFAAIGLFFAVFIFGVIGYTAFWLRGKIDPGGSTQEVTLVVPPDAGLALAHRRLSIVDLSPAGHQPMFSACQRYVIVFNGEIYNFKVLRTDLERGGARFRSRSVVK